MGVVDFFIVLIEEKADWGDDSEVFFLCPFRSENTVV